MSKTENLSINNLIYSLPPSSTAAIERSYKRNYFDNRSYDEGRTMRAVFQTGAQYVSCETSSLVIRLKPTFDGTNVSFSNASAMNLIKNIRVFSKSGVECVNILNANLNRVIEDKHTEKENWFSTIGSLMGYGVVMAVSDQVYEFVIPLSKLAPIFCPQGEQLMPAALANSLIVECDLAPASECWQRNGGTTSTYKIEDIFFNLDCTTLNDMTIMTLNDVTAKQLLEWTYIDTYNSKVTQSSGNSILSTSVNKSVSFSDHITAAIQPQARVTDPVQDSTLIRYDESAGKWQYTLGSLQLPSNVPTDSLQLSYFQALSTYNKLRPRTDQPVQSIPEWEVETAIKSCSFSKDQKLALSQLPISSARSLRLEVNYDSAPAAAQVCNIYLHYVKVLEVSLTDVKVNF